MNVFSITRVFPSKNQHLKPETKICNGCNMILPSLQLELLNRESFEKTEDEKNVNNDVFVGFRLGEEFLSK